MFNHFIISAVKRSGERMLLCRRFSSVESEVPVRIQGKMDGTKYRKSFEKSPQLGSENEKLTFQCDKQGNITVAAGQKGECPISLKSKCFIVTGLKPKQ